LLDVNVLLALAWPHHVHHRIAQTWFAGAPAREFRTCPITQAGFVRISLNPKFKQPPAAEQDVLAMLTRITDFHGHGFWHDDLDLRQALRQFGPITGHSQITDAYLVGLAASKGGVLATFDRAIWQHKRADVELVGA